MFATMNSTPIVWLRTMEFTALVPPPPTPITFMEAEYSLFDSNSISGFLPVIFVIKLIISFIETSLPDPIFIVSPITLSFLFNVEMLG